MRQKLFTVEDHFQIAGRGIVLTGEIEPDSPAVKAGSEIVLFRPDGTKFITEIFGIEQIKPIDYENFNRNRIGVMFKDVNKKEEIPIGTEVFLKF